MGTSSFYITTPIYYVNGPPHFAHAYTTVACDVLARFKRLDGHEVHFVTGVDEHGQKVEQAARAAGVDPQSFCDAIAAEFEAMNRLMDISNDDFIRTTQPRHIRACRALWRTLERNGAIYKGMFGGWYAVRDEAFYDEKELVGGKAPTGAEVQWIEEENYFFRLSDWGESLLAFYDANPEFVAPRSRRNEVISFVKAGLRDLSISRTAFSWGIPVPGDPEHVMYVWLDALTNYLTAAGYADPDADFVAVWPADLHMVGKDILRFHCVYWPAFLMAAGIAPPKRVFAHGWWTVEGEKMSKSLDNFVTPASLVDRYGVDAVRYFMLRELPFGADGDLAHAAIVGRINADLANDLGNLVHRVLSMIHSYFDGMLPEAADEYEADRALIEASEALLPNLRSAMDEQNFHGALEQIWRVVMQANRYVDRQKPWSLVESDRDRLAAILQTLTIVIRRLAILLQPFMPRSAGSLLDQLGVAAEDRRFEALGRIQRIAGGRLPPPEIVFRRRQDEGAAEKVARPA